jgi:hypothetical protein
MQMCKRDVAEYRKENMPEGMAAENGARKQGRQDVFWSGKRRMCPQSALPQQRTAVAGHAVGVRAATVHKHRPDWNCNPNHIAARKHFQTPLLRQGPAPQQGEMLHPPTGAEQMQYEPTLPLQAWITPPASGQAARAK